MQLQPLAAVGGRGERGIQGAARVDDEQVAGGEPSRQIVEARVLDRVGGQVRHEQAHLIAGQAARFGRLTRFERGRQRKVGDYAGCSHRASSC